MEIEILSGEWELEGLVGPGLSIKKQGPRIGGTPLSSVSIVPSTKH